MLGDNEPITFLTWRQVAVFLLKLAYLAYLFGIVALCWLVARKITDWIFH